jgi:lipopolysaccharide biosynthesis glycosyltransferase
MDCDMIVLDDIAKVFARANDDYAVMCVKHDHKPMNTTKFLGAEQTKYEKKNWSSFMLMNNEKCTSLTPDYVETASGLELHQFKWLDNDSLIGELPHEWNCLVGYDDCYGAKCLHYTEGGPYFDDYGDVSHAADWYIEKNRMEAVSTRT